MSYKGHSDPRHLARFLAVQYLFTRLQVAKSNLQLDIFEPNTLLSIVDEKKFNTRLYEQIVEGVEESSEELDDIIRKHAPAWPLEQINPVDLIILRVAIWEGFKAKITPFKVVINEAIEISKVLSSPQSGKFINGVLGSILGKMSENE